MFFAATVRATPVEPLDDNNTRALWQQTVAKRFHSARLNMLVNRSWYEVDNFTRQAQWAEFLGISPAKLVNLKFGRANLSVEEGQRVAAALKAAPWWLLGWDELSRMYRQKPTRLNSRSRSFNEMVWAATKDAKAYPQRNDKAHFEPAPCADLLSDTQLAAALRRRGYLVTPLL